MTDSIIRSKIWNLANALRNLKNCSRAFSKNHLMEKIFNKEKIIKCKQKKEYKPTHILLIIGEE